MDSTLLFHGPGALDAAVSRAHEIGRLLSPPLGKEGLSVEDARQVVALLHSTPVGSAKGVLVVGPIDQAAKQRHHLEKVNDTFLKVIEEPHPNTCVVLWAVDLEEVRPTIRSRCLTQWCPATASEWDEKLESAGRDLVRAALSPDRLYEIPTLVKSCKGQEIELLSVVADAVQGDATKEALVIWERVRRVAAYPNPTPIEIIASLLPEG